MYYPEVYFSKWQFEERPNDSQGRSKVGKQTPTQIKIGFNKNSYHLFKTSLTPRL